MKRITFIAASLMILLFSFGCSKPPYNPRQVNLSTPSMSPSTESRKPTPTQTATVEYPPPAVEFVRVALSGDSASKAVLLTIRNNGSTDAHLTGGCSWKCPVFPESAGGSKFLSGELLGSGKERTFRSTNAGTCALPLQATCSVEVRSWFNGEKGSAKKTVEWAGQLQP